MQTSKEYAATAAQIGKLAEQVKPPDSDKFAQSRNLALFHLRSAAKLMRETSEAIAAREGIQD